MFGIGKLGSKMDSLCQSLMQDMKDNFLYSTLIALEEQNEGLEIQFSRSQKQLLEEREPEYRISDDLIDHQMNFCIGNLLDVENFDFD